MERVDSDLNLRGLGKRNFNKKVIVLSVLIIILLIAITSIFLIYFLGEGTETEIRLGENIKSVSFDVSNEKILIELSENLNLSKIEKKQFFFVDSLGKEYLFESLEASYEYVISSDLISELEDFQDIKQIYVIFIYVNGSVTEVPVDIKKPGNSNSNSNGDGGGDGGNGPGPEPEPSCGDGNCDTNIGETCQSCPGDCGSCIEDSPFGFHPANIGLSGYPDIGFVDASNIGVKWDRKSSYFFWLFIQPDLGSSEYDFTLHDLLMNRTPEGMHSLANIEIAPSSILFKRGVDPASEERLKEYIINHSYLPKDEQRQKYIDFVKATVERYDGDGDSDMPGLKDPIKYWQVSNEPTPALADYAEFLKITSIAIKDVCSDCKVLIGGVAGSPQTYVNDFHLKFDSILEELEGGYIDIFDFHWYGEAGDDYLFIDWTEQNALEHVRQTLINKGFGPEFPLWITETGSYSGDPNPSITNNIDWPYHSEFEQASDYLKRYVYSTASGIKKIFPVYAIMEGYKGEYGYFALTGLIYDGCGWDSNLEKLVCRDEGFGEDLGKGVKKLSYYTYKQMTEKLEGSDWNNIEIIRENETSDEVYTYKFMNAGKPIWVAWSDSESGEVTLSGINSENVKITEAIPKYETGQEVADYSTAFNTQTKAVSGGIVTITIGEVPVFVEETGEIPLEELILQLTQIIPEVPITPGDAKYGRPEALVVENSLFMAYEKVGEDKFELVKLNEDLTYKSPKKTIYSGPISLSPHDIRIANAGTKLWYAFETVNNTDRVTCSSRYLNIAKYDTISGLPIFNNKVNEISGCGTSPQDYANPNGSIVNNPEAVDDPAPIYYNGEYIIITRAWNGTKQHVRKFNESLDLTDYFLLDLGILPEMQGKILSQSSLVNINGEIYLIAGLINQSDRSDSTIYAIHLSGDLKSASEAIPLVNYPGRTFRKVNRAIFDDGKLYITYKETKEATMSYHNLGVYDVNNDFAKIQEIQFQDETFQFNHASMEIFNNKVFVFYNEGDHMVNVDVLGQVFEWQEIELSELSIQNTLKIIMFLLIGIITILIIMLYVFLRKK